MGGPPTSGLRATARRLVAALLGYLLGFLALAVFAALAYGGGTPSDERFVQAFRVGGLLAAGEVAVLLGLAAPANRLILGANLWLMAGGLAAVTEQWWLLRAYQFAGEASLFGAMVLVGLCSTLASPAGFVGVAGDPRRVRQASLVLLAASLGALGAAVYFRGDVRLAAVLPVIALSWGLRLLRRLVRAGGPSAEGSRS